MFAVAAAKDLQTLILCRFFSGVFASCPLAIVGGAFSDLFGNKRKGISIAGFSGLVFIGPSYRRLWELSSWNRIFGGDGRNISLGS